MSTADITTIHCIALYFTSSFFRDRASVVFVGTLPLGLRLRAVLKNEILRHLLFIICIYCVSSCPRDRCPVCSAVSTACSFACKKFRNGASRIEMRWKLGWMLCGNRVTRMHTLCEESAMKNV